ncbi:MAG: hypothetical protein IJF34_02940 [Clostridia bacterium]|nr:hypothetical protein [Clostridia bacterium]
MSHNIHKHFGLLAILLFITIIVSSCNTSQQEPIFEKHSIPFSTVENNPASYHAEYMELSNYGSPIDIFAHANEYSLLYQNSSGCHSLILDASFTPTVTQSLPVFSASTALLLDQTLYTCSLFSEDKGTSYAIFENGSLLFLLPNTGHIAPHTIIEHNGSIYTFFHENYETALYVNDNLLLPPEQTADGWRYEIIGLTKWQEAPYAILQKRYKPEGAESSTNYSIFLVSLENASTYLEESVLSIPMGISSRWGLFCSTKEELYMVGGDIVYCVTENSYTELFNLSYFGLDGKDISLFRTGKNGELFFLCNETLTIITPSLDKENIPVQKITIGTLADEGSDFIEIEDIINTYNRLGRNYKVIPKFYRSRENLNLAILSGEVDLIQYFNPDIFLTYTSRGILQPLDEIVPDLFNEGVLMNNIKEAYCFNDHWFYLPLSVEACGLTLPKDLMGERTAFSSMEEFIDFVYSADSALLRATHRENIFNVLIYGGIENWINWETGTASFTDTSFISTLELCGKCSEWDVASQFLRSPQIGRFNSCLSDLIYVSDDTETGKSQVVAFSVPVNNNNGMSLIGSAYIAKPISAPNSQGADDFLRYLFTEMKWPSSDTIEPHGPPSFSGAPIKQDDAERYFLLEKPTNRTLHQLLWDHHSQADHVFYYGKLTEVIDEEASRYFAGDITAEQAAAYIQNRVSIYLAEQR